MCFIDDVIALRSANPVRFGWTRALWTLSVGTLSSTTHSYRYSYSWDKPPSRRWWYFWPSSSWGRWSWWCEITWNGTKRNFARSRLGRHLPGSFRFHSKWPKGAFRRIFGGQIAGHSILNTFRFSLGDRRDVSCIAPSPPVQIMLDLHSKPCHSDLNNSAWECNRDTYYILMPQFAARHQNLSCSSWF